MQNLTIIGTSHISKESIKEIKDFFEKTPPDIVAIELDAKRLPALMSKKQKISIRSITRIGFKGFLFSVIGAYVEKKLGEQVGISPGEEMKTAIKLAKKNNIKLALIDQDIEITLKRLSKSISWKERWTFVKEIIKAVFQRKKTMQFDLNKVPEQKIIEKMIKEVKQKYPNIYKVLIKERNHIMAKRLRHIMLQNPDKKILALVGAGHKEDMIKILNNNIEDSPQYSYSLSYSV